MTQQKIQERNKHIAKMLGADVQDNLEKIYIDEMIDNELTFHNMSVELNTYEWGGTSNIHYIPFEMLQFHSDWNWLMEAVEFIEKQQYNIEIGFDNCSIQSNDGEYSVSNNWMINCSYDEIVAASSKKEAVFTAVSDFAKLYNEKKL